MASLREKDFHLHRAWTRVSMEVRHSGQEVGKIKLNQPDLACKLQFALYDEKTKRSFNFRLQEKGISFGVEQGNNEESVLVELQKDLLKDEVKDAVKDALKDITIKKLEFENEQKLEEVLDTLDQYSKDFLSNGSVGLFSDSSADIIILNIVGGLEDVATLGKKFESGRQACKALSPGTGTPAIFWDKARKIYVATHVYDMDTIKYLHLLNFKQQVSKNFQNVEWIEVDDNETRFQIKGKLRNDVADANEYIAKCVNTIVRKNIPVSDILLKFLQAEGIMLDLKEKLGKLPALFLVSNEIVVLAPKKLCLENAEKILHECISISEEIVTGIAKIPSEVNSIIENSGGKIQLIETTAAESNVEGRNICHIVYLEEMSAEAQRLRDYLKWSLEPKVKEKKAYYKEHVIKYLMASQLEDEIKKACPYVEVKYDMQFKSVTISSEHENDLKNALEELHVYANRIKKVELKNLSEGVRKLLIRPHISEYVGKTLKCNTHLLFEYEGENFVCIGQKLGPGKKLAENIMKYCILSTILREDFLQMDYGRDFLDKNADRIVVDEEKEDINKNASQVCYTADLQEEINSFVERCSSHSCYRKKFNPAFSDFLQLPNLSIVRKIEDEFNVNICFENGQVVFNGDDDSCKKACKELVRRVSVDELLLMNGDRYKSGLESEKGKKIINEIAAEKNCFWSMSCNSDDKTRKLDKIMMNGINHIVSWVQTDDKTTVSVVEADFSRAEFDILVILVDDKLCGESIFTRDGKIVDYGSMFNKKLAKPLQLGSYELLKNCENLPAKTVALVPSCRVIISDGTQSTENVKGKTLKKVITQVLTSALKINHRKVGFAIPASSQSFCTSVVCTNVMLGFLDAVKSVKGNVEPAYLYLCTKQEAEIVAADIEKAFREKIGSKHIRRIVTNANNGIFNKPEVSVEVVKKSVFDVQAECLVVLTSKNLGFDEGTLSKKVLEKAGASVSKEISGKYKQKTLENGEFITTSPGNLKQKCVKRLLFGYLPKWLNHKERLQVLQQFVEGCLVEADEQSCKSVAFPALGTGNLKYPPRDVAAAMLDGIESYIEESISGKVKTVYITTMDDEIFQILNLEQKIRGDINTRNEADIANDGDVGEILTARDQRIFFSVVKEGYLKMNPSGKFVNVKFLPGTEAGNKEYTSNWQLQIGCGLNIEEFKKAVQQMVQHCEKMFITSVRVFCSQGSKLSFGDQAEAIIDTVYNMPAEEYPSRIYKYLSNVTIVAGDEAGFSNIEMKLSKRSWFDLIFGAEREWKKEAQSKPQCSIRIKIIGELEEDVKAAKREIEKYIYTTDFEKPDVSKQVAHHEAKEHVKVGNNVQEEQIDMFSQYRGTTENEEKGKLTTHMDSTDVSAEINKGIVNNLESMQNYSHWKKEIEHMYDIHITKDRDNKSQMNVSGSFESILRFEHYLNEEFPNFPKDSRSEEIEYSDFGMTDQNVAVEIPMNKDEKSKVMKVYHEEINQLIEKGILSQCSSSSEDTFTLRCRQDKAAHVQAQFYFFKKKIQGGRKFQFASLEVMKKAINFCEKHYLDATVFINNESEMEIEIIGLDSTSLENLGKDLQRVVAEAYEESYTVRRRNYIFDGKVNVHIYQSDILQTDVDCIVSSGGMVADCIAKCAGKNYTSQVEKIYKNKLTLSRCSTTGAGDLKKMKKVIHVNCSFVAGDYPDYQGLQIIQESVENCVLEADRQKMKSVALPFICTGGSGYAVNECAQQYIRALCICGQKLKNVLEIHFVDKFSQSVEEVCKIFDGYFEMKKGNTGHLSAFDRKGKYTIKDTTIKFCNGDIQLSIAHGIAIFVDKHSEMPGNSQLLINLQEIEKTDFVKMIKRVRESNDMPVVSSNCRMMYDVLIAACPTIGAKDNDGKAMHDTVTKILKKATDKGFVSFAISLPETNMGKMTGPFIQGFSQGLVDYLLNVRTSLKYVVIVGTQSENIKNVSQTVEDNIKISTETKFRGISHHGFSSIWF